MLAKKLIVVLICFVAPFCTGNFVNALPIEYRVDYDPAQKITTFFNSPSSSADLMFWTTSGPYQNSTLWVPPSGTVAIDQFGNITGSFMASGTDCKNVIHWDKDWTITNTDDYDVIIEYKPEGDRYELDNKGDQHTVPECQKFTVSGRGWAATGCLIESTEDSLAFFYSDSWLGIPDQERVELLSGSVWSTDDTDNFVSIFTPIASTGCIPEPSTMLLLGSGLIGLAGFSRKKFKK